jgi:TPP-dependent pyruvate/acetoin dehydrogenase alpha subunit
MPDSSKNEKLIGGILSKSKARELLYKMVLTRSFEENAEEMYALGKVHGTMHLYIGEEAIAAGAGPALKRTDYLLNTHRGHGHFLAWGGDLNRMMAEFLARKQVTAAGARLHAHSGCGIEQFGRSGYCGRNLPISVALDEHQNAQDRSGCFKPCLEMVPQMKRFP